MFLLVDKPKGITSHDVIDVVRKVTGEQKVGHAGTLDPNATGLLVVGVGRDSTKRLGDISQKTKKTYLAEIFLGEERDSGDAEGAIISKTDVVEPPSLEEVKRVLTSFEGEQEQIPPVFSAIKVGGKKAYELARKGEKIKLQPRKIIVHSINLIGYKFPSIDIECTVSSGTYIRALARDIGRSLKTGAHLKNLKRKSIGKYLVKDAVFLNNLTKENWKEFVIQ